MRAVHAYIIPGARVSGFQPPLRSTRCQRHDLHDAGAAHHCRVEAGEPEMGSQALAMRDAGKEREQHLRTVHASLDSVPTDRKSLRVASEGRQLRAVAEKHIRRSSHCRLRHFSRDAT